jgi:CRISPR/Cas system-associated exonuclease Cas4 (RecB family)
MNTPPKQGTVLPYSISTLDSFETCPRRYYLTKIIKIVQEPQSEATLHGNEVHKALENGVKARTPLPDKFRQYQDIINKVLASPGTKDAERKFALNQSFKPTTFFAKDAWVRGVIDLTITNTEKKTAIALDWKTGKPKSDPSQLKLTAAVLFAEKPWLQTVKTGYVWLAHGKIDTETYDASQAAGIWQEFLPRVNRMVRAEATKDFPPKPSGLCRPSPSGYKGCPVGRANCEFCGA